jgi:hypothetical protein
MLKSYKPKSSNRIALTLMTAVFLSGAVAWLNTGVGAHVNGPGDDCDQQCEKDLSTARAATAPYHQESRALADGFFPDPICVEAPDVGGMGVHYANPSRTNNLFVDPAAPELLLYEPQPDGTRRLIAVEYFAPVIVNGAPWFGPGPPPNGQYNAAPVLFGRAFNGPMPGHNPGMPWHYDLHVWLWRNNPAGMFTPFNPKVSCS